MADKGGARAASVTATDESPVSQVTARSAPAQGVSTDDSLAKPEKNTVSLSPLSVPSRGASRERVPAIGEVIAGRYRILGEIGAGGMGVVMSAMHIELEDKVAVKFMTERADSASVARFKREAQVALKLRSEHATRLMDVGSLPDGTPFLVMELLEGRNLARVLREDGRFEIPLAIELVRQAIDAVAEAHLLGVVHRDLKPSNLLVTTATGGEPLMKVLDFGIAKLLDSPLGMTKSGPTELTSEAIVLGSPGYMSVEQFRSAKDVDTRTDVWSLGVILYEMLTQRLPFEGDTPSAIMAAVVADPPAPLRRHRPDVPASLERIVARCLEKDRTRRFGSVRELGEALAAVRIEGGNATRRAWPVLAALGALLAATVAFALLRSPASSRDTSARKEPTPIAEIRPPVPTTSEPPVSASTASPPSTTEPTTTPHPGAEAMEPPVSAAETSSAAAPKSVAPTAVLRGRRQTPATESPRKPSATSVPVEATTHYDVEEATSTRH